MPVFKGAIRERLVEARRDQILDAAAAVFAEKGFHRATTKEIAEVADAAEGTIYNYFENKRELLLAIADRLIAQPVGEALTAAAGLGAEEYVAAVLRDRIRFARENQAFLQAVIGEIWTDVELRTRFFTQVMGPILAAGARYLQGKVAEGKVRPCRVEVVVPAIAASIVILANLRTLAPEHLLAGVSDDELVEELARLYFCGLQPLPGEGKA